MDERVRGRLIGLSRSAPCGWLTYKCHARETLTQPSRLSRSKQGGSYGTAGFPKRKLIGDRMPRGDALATARSASMRGLRVPHSGECGYGVVCGYYSASSSMPERIVPCCLCWGLKRWMSSVSVIWMPLNSLTSVRWSPLVSFAMSSISKARLF